MFVHQRGAGAYRSIAGHEIDRAGPRPRAAPRHAFTTNGKRADLCERSVHPAKFQVLRRREPQPLPRADWKMRREMHQLLGMGIPDRPQDDRVDDREDRGVDADAERQRHQRHGGEHGTAPKRAKRVAQIASDLVQPGAVTSRPHALLRLFHAPEMKHRRPPCVSRRRTVAHAVGSGHVYEGVELVVQIALGASAIDHPAHDGRESMQERHAPSRTRATANDARFQRSRCCSSCRRPDAVSR